jgi:hypothetical protein
MQWHMWVVLIAGSTGSALRAVRCIPGVGPLLAKKRYDLATLQLPADNHLAGSINAMHLKD